MAKIEKMIKKKEMTVRKFEKKWVPHGHIMVYKWVTDTKRDGDDAPPVPAAPAGGGYGDYAYGELPMRRKGTLSVRVVSAVISMKST